MNLVVVGAQWGDEGKGKIVDFLAEDSDLIVRFSGGANAGHTIVTGDVTYKLHLVPSGIIYPDKKVVLGTGMVIDPDALFTELATIEEQGINWKNRIYISDRAHLVLPRYREEDIELDKKRRNPIGTTGRGIGVTYAHKAHRDGIRVGDLYNEKLYASLSDEDREYLGKYKDLMKEMVIDLVSFMAENKGKRTLFEGAQGVLARFRRRNLSVCILRIFTVRRRSNGRRNRPARFRRRARSFQGLLDPRRQRSVPQRISGKPRR